MSSRILSFSQSASKDSPHHVRSSSLSFIDRSYDHDQFMSQSEVALNMWSITLTSFCVRESPCCDRYALLWVRHSYLFCVLSISCLVFHVAHVSALRHVTFLRTWEYSEVPCFFDLHRRVLYFADAESSQMIRTSSPTQFQFFHHTFQVRITFTNNSEIVCPWHAAKLTLPSSFLPK